MDAKQMNDWNAQIIEEFRANEGRVGGQFEGAPLLLLHTTGARTGQARINPMMYQDLGEGRLAVFASKAGAPSHPAWYHNAKANPQVTVEVGTQTLSGTVVEATGSERDAIWEQQKSDYPTFAQYEANTDRIIPVLIVDTNQS